MATLLTPPVTTMWTYVLHNGMQRLRYHITRRSELPYHDCLNKEQPGPQALGHSWTATELRDNRLGQANCPLHERPDRSGTAITRPGTLHWHLTLGSNIMATELLSKENHKTYMEPATPLALQMTEQSRLEQSRLQPIEIGKSGTPFP